MTEAGVGKLLVVGDDQMMRNSVTAILAALGYDIVEAKDGLEALLVYRARRAEISLVIMDTMLPRMDGITAAKVIKATDPTVKVILMSGHSELDPAEAQADAFIPKPFRGKDLLDMVQKILQDDRPLPWVNAQPT
jgi:two-component system, cell cycle sensor histidine kinase and response regulator CckA